MSLEVVETPTTKVSLESLPEDVWFLLSCLFSVKSLCFLRAVGWVLVSKRSCTVDNFFQTSKRIRIVLSDIHVWITVFTDLLAVKPLPYSSSDIEAMSSEELRLASIRLVRIDESFSSARIVHKPSHVIKVGEDCVEVRLLPGGDRYVALSTTGNVRLCAMDASKPISVVSVRYELRTPTTFTPKIRIFPQDLHSGYVSIRDE